MVPARFGMRAKALCHRAAGYHHLGSGVGPDQLVQQPGGENRVADLCVRRPGLNAVHFDGQIPMAGSSLLVMRGRAAMAGVAAGLPQGRVRLSDHISLGVIARAVPPARVQEVLAETGKASERERDLPAPVIVYYAIALALYMESSTREVLRCLLEGLRQLWGAEAVKSA